MKKIQWSRREFLKTTTAAVVLGVAADKALSALPATLPKRRLGKTSEMVSCIGFGCGTGSVRSKAKTPRRRCSSALSIWASITSTPLAPRPAAAANA